MSETFQVTALKWRPMRFEDVAGQGHITRTLKNAIASGRLAHAFLFTGQRGCGKTTVARILAKAINCPNAAANGYEPCNTCENCRAITEGRSMDVSEIDGASNNGVDDVRELRENVKYPPLHGTYKVIIIDEVHMLTQQAFNALLKTLEEPPKYLVFIFATTEAQKVLPTILSRTQRYDFRRIQLDDITTLLRKIADADGISIEDDALVLIAKKADGSARDAESIFDQVVAFTGTKVETARLREALNLIDLDFYFEVSDAIAGRNPKRAFELSGEIISRGYDVEEFFSGLLEHFRNVLTVTITNSTKLLEVSKVHQERYADHAKQFSEGDLLRLIRLGQAAYERLKLTHDPRIVLEVALVEMMLLERAMEISDLLNEVRALRGMGSGVRATGSGAAIPIPEKKNERAIAANGTQMANAPKENIRPSDHGSRTPDPAEIASRWVSFGDFVRTKSKPLFSIFPEIEFCGVRRKDDRLSTVYLGVPGKIEKDMLMNLKDEMQLALREFFGAPLDFEAGARTAMLTKAGSPIVTNPEIVESIMPTAKPGNPERSELEMALMERLGAQEIV
ncbi:MAG TPA: DNA polymerase III subunit gamma/tau [Candidatus Kapabacteria bacterium]|nr:DNA polymerase III subunit gamma/tau [Candidatus Kapabacteria bacterium]